MWEGAILRATGGSHPIDVAFVAEEEDAPDPRKTPPPSSSTIPGPLPESLKLVLANQIFVEKANLPQPLANRMIRLAAFQNPEVYRAQAMRMPVWNKPRVIGCVENYPRHIGLPRCCWDALLELLKRHGIRVECRDERDNGIPISACFKEEGTKSGGGESRTHDQGLMSH